MARARCGGLLVRPDAGIEQHLPGEPPLRIALEVDGDRGRQVAPGRTAAHRDPGRVEADLGGVVEGPPGGRQGVVVAGRERVLGGEAIVHRQDPEARIGGQPAAMAVMGLQVADGETAAVEID
jgi:hypothetical protein